MQVKSWTMPQMKWETRWSSQGAKSFAYTRRSNMGCAKQGNLQ